jgi:hypothetical protein
VGVSARCALVHALCGSAHPASAPIWLLLPRHQFLSTESGDCRPAAHFVQSTAAAHHRNNSETVVLRHDRQRRIKPTGRQ